MPTPTSGSDSKPQVQKTSQSKTMKSDSGHGIQKGLETKSGTLKTSGSKPIAQQKSKSKTIDPKASPYQTSALKTSDSKTTDSKASPYQTSALKTSDSKTINSKASPYQTTDFKTSDSRAIDTKASPYQTTDFKTSDSTAIDSKASPYQAFALKTSDSKTINLKASPYQTTALKTPHSKTSSPLVPESKFVTPKTSESSAVSRQTLDYRTQTLESRSGSSQMSASKPDSVPTPETSSIDSESSGSTSDFSKWSDPQSSVSRKSDLKSSASNATSRQTSSVRTYDSKPGISKAPDPNSGTSDSTPRTGRAAAEPRRHKNGPFSRAKNFLRSHLFSPRSSRSSSAASSSSAQPEKNATKQPEAVKTVPIPILITSSKPSLLSSLASNASSPHFYSTSSTEDQPGPLPDKFSWSRASYSAPPSQRLAMLNDPMDSVSESELDIMRPARKSSGTTALPTMGEQTSSWETTTEIFPTAWFANPTVLNQVDTPTPTAAAPVEAQEASGQHSPQIASLMAMNTRRRASLTIPVIVPDRQNPSSNTDIRRSRSGTRDGKKDSRHIMHRISFQNRPDPDEPFPAASFVSWDVELPVALYMASTGPLAQPPITVMTALNQAASKHPNKVVYGVKEDGLWKTITCQQLLDTVNQAAKGFIKLGLERHSVVAILGHNSTEWVISHLAAIFAGGISASMHVTSVNEDIVVHATQTKCRIMVVGSSKELNRVQVLRGRLKQQQLVIVQCSKDDFVKSDGVYSWDELLNLGHDVSSEVLHERALQQAPNACCSLVQPIGSSADAQTTVLLSHDNVTWGSNSIGRNLGLTEANSVTVSFMPLSYMVTQIMDIYIPILFGVAVYFAPASPIQGSVFDIVRDVRPTLFWTTSELYEDLMGAMVASWNRNPFTKALRKFAVKIGLKGHATRGQKPMPVGWSAANSVVCKRIRKEFGLTRCAAFMLVGGSVRQDVWDFYYGLNMDLLMSYGMTMSTGYHTISMRDRHRMQSVGIEMDGCMTTIERPNEEGVGELLLKGRNLAMGYLGLKDRTLSSFTDDGWFRTGDLGRRDKDGFLYVLGRIDQQIQLSTGETVLPIDIELSVSHHLPCVHYSVVVGKNKPYLGLLMTLKTKLDPSTGQHTTQLSKESVRWFANAGQRVSTISDVVLKPSKRATKRVQEAIDEVNAKAPWKSHHIVKWIFLPVVFSLETGEIGQSLTVKRWVVEEMYKRTINSLYD